MKAVSGLTIADKLLAGLVVLLLAGLYGQYWTAGAQAAGERVRLSSSEDGIRIMPFGEDRLFSISGPLGTTRLQIKGGRIRFVSSPCTGKQCIHAGWLSRAGDFAACLPNRISLTVLGQMMEYDSINF